jgi:hypothetical protein
MAEVLLLVIRAFADFETRVSKHNIVEIFSCFEYIYLKFAGFSFLADKAWVAKAMKGLKEVMSDNFELGAIEQRIGSTLDMFFYTFVANLLSNLFVDQESYCQFFDAVLIFTKSPNLIKFLLSSVIGVFLLKKESLKCCENFGEAEKVLNSKISSVPNFLKVCCSVTKELQHVASLDLPINL